MNQEQFFNLAYSKGYNFKTMSDTSILHRIKKVVEVYYDLDDLAEKTRAEPVPTAKKIYIKLADAKYRGKVKNVVELIGKNHASYSTDLKAANGFLEVDKRFIVDYNRICNALEHSYDLETPKHVLNLNVIEPEIC